MTSSASQTDWVSRQRSREFFTRIFNSAILNNMLASKGIYPKLIEDMEDPRELADWNLFASEAAVTYKIRLPDHSFWFEQSIPTPRKKKRGN